MVMMMVMMMTVMMMLMMVTMIVLWAMMMIVVGTMVTMMTVVALIMVAMMMFVLMMVMLMVMMLLVQGSSNGEPRNPHPCTTLKLRAGSLLVRLRVPRATVGSRVLRRSTYWVKKGSSRALHLSPTHPHPAHTGPCRNEGTRQSPRTRHVVGISSESQGHP
jgi:hypothetical protein